MKIPLFAGTLAFSPFFNLHFLKGHGTFINASQHSHPCEKENFMETVPDTSASDGNPNPMATEPKEALRRIVWIVLAGVLFFGLAGIFSKNFLENRNVAVLQDVVDMTEVTVLGVVMDSLSGSPAVFLFKESDDMFLPIWIGANEAVAIQAELAGVKSPRPLTNDLLKTVIEKLEASLQKIVITKVQDDTYYALLNLKSKSGDIEIDARPSDAIGLAIRFKCPIFVSNKVLKQYGLSSRDAAKKRIEKSKKI